MNSPDMTPCREDVLGSFAVESDHSAATLERYLHAYPQFADDLIDLSQELATPVDINTAPLSAKDRVLIESAWQRYAATEKKAVSPMEQLDVQSLRVMAQQLGVPRQILVAFREHRVLVASVPRPFMERLADQLKTPVEELKNILSFPPPMTLSRSYKSDTKPEAAQRTTFEQLLIDAAVPLEQRSALLVDNG